MSTLSCPRCGEAVPVEPARPVLRCSAEAYERVGRSLARYRHERFYAVSLDARNRVLRRHLVAVGSVSAVVVHPREVFRAAIRAGASALIVLHNHPTDVLDPSPEDLQITQRLIDAGRTIGIPLIDHLIVGRGGYVSMRDMGVFQESG